MSEARSIRSVFALLTGERVLTHNLIVGIGTITAGTVGVAFQSLVSHNLRPADYGGVFAAVTLITLVSLPAGAFSLLMARQASRDRARGEYAPSETLLRQGNRVLLIAGLALASVIGLASPLLAKFLDVPGALLLAAAAGIPFGLGLPLLTGEFQGEQRFITWSMLTVGQAALKLLAAITLGLAFGPVGVVAGISFSTAAIYFGACWILRNKLATKPTVPWLRPAVAYLAVIVPSTLSLAVLLSADILIVKHYFPTRPAGEYAATAALGRAIFWGASGVAAVLFPKIVYSRIKGQTGLHLIAASLALVAVGGLLGFALLTFASTWLLTAFAGIAYEEAASLLPWYAVGMTLLGGSAVLVATHQSRGKPGFLAVLLPLTVLEPALLVAFHQTLLQVVQVVDIAMALVLVGLGAKYIVEERASGPVAVAVPTAQVAVPVAPRLQGNQ